MEAKTCPKHGCEAVVRRKSATELNTLVSADKKTKTTFDVRYCDGGHVLAYIDRTIPVNREAPIRQ